MNPAPLLPPDVDLRDFTFMPIDIVRLFGSDFHARSTDAEWRAGMTLWLKSFHQVPAGAVPDNDIALARLAEFGRDVTGWQEAKSGALHGWVLCSDGRHYHPVVCEKALEAWIGKLLQRRSGIIGNAKRWKVEANTDDIDRQLNEAAAALQRLSPNSPSLRKWQSSGNVQGTQSSPPEDSKNDDGSHPDPNPIAGGSRPDRDPIAEGSQGIGKGIGKVIGREPRAGAAPPLILSTSRSQPQSEGELQRIKRRGPPTSRSRLACASTRRSMASIPTGCSRNSTTRRSRRAGSTATGRPPSAPSLRTSSRTCPWVGRTARTRITPGALLTSSGGPDALGLRNPLGALHSAPQHRPRQSQSEVPAMFIDSKTQTRPVPVRDDQIRWCRVALPQLRLAGRAAL